MPIPTTVAQALDPSAAGFGASERTPTVRRPDRATDQAVYLLAGLTGISHTTVYRFLCGEAVRTLYANTLNAALSEARTIRPGLFEV